MSAKRGERILGPYADRDKWRVIECDAAGNRSALVFDTEAKADRYVEVMRAELEKEDHDTATALVQYKAHLTDKGNRPDSVRQTCWAIGLYFPTAIPLASLTSKRCAALYDELRTRPRPNGKPVSVDTHRGVLAQVRTFLAWCIERGWIRGDNPAGEVKGIGRRRPRGKSLGKEGTELRVKEARAWFDHAVYRAHRGDQGAIAALTAMLLGMRASEITTRRVRDLDTDEQPGDLLWIPCSKTPAGRRTLEVPDVLRVHLVALAKDRAPDSYLFATDEGGAHWRDWVRKNVRRICNLAGVPKVTAHAMRGLLATLTSQRGLAGHLVAATLGHEDERTTMTAYAAPGAAAAGASRRGLVLLAGGQR